MVIFLVLFRLAEKCPPTIITYVVFHIKNVEFNLQHLQVGEAAESSISNEANAVVSDVQLIQEAEAYETGFLQSGKMVGRKVAVEQIQNKTVRLEE